MKQLWVRCQFHLSFKEKSTKYISSSQNTQTPPNCQLACKWSLYRPSTFNFFGVFTK